MMFILIEEFCENCGHNHGFLASTVFESNEAANEFMAKHGATENYTVNNTVYCSVDSQVDYCECHN